MEQESVLDQIDALHVFINIIQGDLIGKDSLQQIIEPARIYLENECDPLEAEKIANQFLEFARAKRWTDQQVVEFQMRFGFNPVWEGVKTYFEINHPAYDIIFNQQAGIGLSNSNNDDTELLERPILLQDDKLKFLGIGKSRYLDKTYQIVVGKTQREIDLSEIIEDFHEIKFIRINGSNFPFSTHLMMQTAMHKWVLLPDEQGHYQFAGVFPMAYFLKDASLIMKIVSCQVSDEVFTLKVLGIRHNLENLGLMHRKHSARISSPDDFGFWPE